MSVPSGKPQGCVWISEVLLTQTGLAKDLPVQGIQPWLLDGFRHAATLVEGTDRGAEWDGDEIWSSFNSLPCSLLLLTLFAACVRKQNKVQKHW